VGNGRGGNRARDSTRGTDGRSSLRKKTTASLKGEGASQASACKVARKKGNGGNCGDAGSLGKREAWPAVIANKLAG